MAMRRKNSEPDITHPSHEDTSKLVLVNISPNTIGLRAYQNRADRRIKVPPFGVVLANSYWQEGLRQVRHGKSANSNDTFHSWAVLKHVTLGLDLLPDNAALPPQPDVADKQAYAQWLYMVHEHPIDEDKFSKYFDPQDARKHWNPIYEPCGVQVITRRQALQWLVNYFHVGIRWIEAYGKLAANVWTDTDGQEKPGVRNAGKPFAQDHEDVRSFGARRIKWLEDEMNKRGNVRGASRNTPFSVGPSNVIR